MPDPEVLDKLMEEAKKQVEDMPDWMKNQEPTPGKSYQEWYSCKDRQSQDL